MSVNTKVNGQLVKSAGLYKVTAPIGMADIYSLEERQVGVWTDGKPLYQKSFIISSFSDISGSIDVSSLSIDKLIKREGVWLRNTSPLQEKAIEYRSENPTNAGYGLTIELRGRTSLAWDFYGYSLNQLGEIRLTVQYTKTTDVPGSGIYVPSGGGTDLITTLAEMGITATFVGDYSEMYNDFNHIVRLKDETMNGQGVYFTNNQHFGGVDLPLTLAVRSRKGMIQIGYGTGTLPTMISEGTGRTQFKNIPAGGFDTIAIPYGSVGYIGKYFVSEDVSKECVFEIGI